MDITIKFAEIFRFFDDPLEVYVKISRLRTSGLRFDSPILKMSHQKSEM